MNTFDIRTGAVNTVDYLRFADPRNSSGYNIVAISYEEESIKFHTTDDLDREDTTGYIQKKDVPNLLLALAKAKELGWLPAPVVAKPAVKKSSGKEVVCS